MIWWTSWCSGSELDNLGSVPHSFDYVLVKLYLSAAKLKLEYEDPLSYSSKLVGSN